MASTLPSTQAIPKSVSQTPPRSPWPIRVILAIAAVLYLYQLGYESLWMDELLSIQDAKDLSASATAWLIPRVFYYVTLRGWMVVGETDVWLRLMSVLCTLAAVAVMYDLGRRLVGQPTAWVGTALFAWAPLTMNHAQEVRMYGISVLLTLSGTLVMVRLLQEAPRPRWLIGWALLRYLAIVTTPLNLLILLPDVGLYVWYYRRRSQLLQLGAGLLGIGVLWLPQLLQLALALGPQFMGGWRAEAVTTTDRAVSLPRPGWVDLGQQVMRFTLWSFGRPNSDAIWGFYRGVSGLLTGLMAVGLVLKPRQVEVYWLAAWAFLPLVPLFIVSQVTRSLWIDRYLFFTSPYWCLLVAAGLWRLWQRWRSLVIPLVGIYAIALAGSWQRYYTVRDREDWRSLVEFIETHAGVDDAVVWAIGQNDPVALNHYYDGVAPVVVTLPPPLPEQAGVDGRSAALHGGEFRDWVAQLPPGRDRLFIVHPYRDKVTRKPWYRLVAGTFIPKAAYQMRGIEVFVVQVPSDDPATTTTSTTGGADRLGGTEE